MPHKDKEKARVYQKIYQSRLSTQQRLGKAERMRNWWKSDKGKYSSHKARAKRMGIPFKLSFDDWLNVWKDSGHYEERGPLGYVMCRTGDEGAYEIGNVYIAHASENKKDAWYNNKVCLPNTGLFYKDII